MSASILSRVRGFVFDLDGCVWNGNTLNPGARETLAALDELVRDGKVRYVGCSNFAGWQVADAAWTARTAGLAPFISVQNRYSLLNRRIEDDVVPAAEEFGLGVLPYFPLEYGLLTGKYTRDAEAPAGSREGPSPLS